jgi:hypothetical protein
MTKSIHIPGGGDGGVLSDEMGENRRDERKERVS